MKAECQNNRLNATVITAVGASKGLVSDYAIAYKEEEEEEEEAPSTITAFA